MDGVKYIFENGCTFIFTDREAKRLYDYLHTIYADHEDVEETEDEWIYQRWNNVFDDDLEHF